MEECVSAIVITSPCLSNPDTTVIDTTLSSLQYLLGLENIPIYIILDGYTLHSTPQTKKGRITSQMEENYELYYQRLLQKYSFSSPSSISSSRYHIRRLEQHYGYAHAVQYGLQLCQTTYAVIVQHDRQFLSCFPHMPQLLTAFISHPHIRYIGFPTVTSCNHCRTLQCRYNLVPLVHPTIHDRDEFQSTAIRIPLPLTPDPTFRESDERIKQRKEQETLGEDAEELIHYEIQPTIFWYDSNHICHVQRYLEIYTPFLAMPPTLKSILQERDPGLIRRLILHKGDFIEDRFGQVQRNLLVSLKQDPSVLLQTHRWFGSYLLYSHQTPEEQSEDESSEGEEKEVKTDGEEKVVDEKKDLEGIAREQDQSALHINRARYKSNPFSQISSRIMVSHLRGRQFRVKKDDN
jgi:hypothetical protein